MKLLRSADRRFLQDVSNLAHANPFLPERIEYERAALGSAFIASEPVWSISVADPEATRPNVVRLFGKLETLLEEIQPRFTHAASVTPSDLTLYEECVHYLLYQRYYARFGSAQADWRFYGQFQADWERYLNLPGKQFETALQPAHLFACFRQVQRAFHHIFDNIIGSSLPAARLRASVWQSIFTHDLRRYRRQLYQRLGDFPTLITGPSGTGKELVARAIAESRYVPFDPARRAFPSDRKQTFYPVNVAALSPTLVESELFGHCRGAFTGATADRKGWLEACPLQGAVFLDELGELDLAMQVKLLRAIETRQFSPVGDTAPRHFQGKLIAATNRNLRTEVYAKRFREDLYYRLCADLIETPALAEQIQDSPAVLQELLLHMLRRAVGGEAEQCLPAVEHWIETHLPRNYSWPGNYRELEQCVRNILIRQSYQPLGDEPQKEDNPLSMALREGCLTADELLAHYAALVYGQSGSYEEAARRLQLDRRTVKAKVEAYLAGQTSQGSR